MNMNKNVKEKMEKIGEKYDEGETTEEMIKEIEEVVGVKIPLMYRNYVQNYKGFDVEDKLIMSIRRGEVDWDMSSPYMYGLIESKYNGLLGGIETYRGRIPDELIPIAEMPFGDQICLGVKGECKGGVYFWNHDKEYMDAEDEEDAWIPIEKKFDNFNEYILSLEALSDEELEELK